MANDLKRLKFIAPISVSCIYLCYHNKLLTNFEEIESHYGFLNSLKLLSNKILFNQENCNFASEVIVRDFNIKNFKGILWIKKICLDIKKKNGIGLQWQMNAIQKCADIS